MQPHILKMLTTNKQDLPMVTARDQTELSNTMRGKYLKSFQTLDQDAQFNLFIISRIVRPLLAYRLKTR